MQDENAEARLARMKAMHRARAKRYYAKKKNSQAEPEPPEPAEAPSSETSGTSESESEVSVKRRRMNDVSIPYSDIKKCVKKVLKEERAKSGNGAGYAAAAVGGIGLISTILNRLPDNINPMRFLASSGATSCSQTVLPSPLPPIVQSDALPSINVGD